VGWPPRDGYEINQKERNKPYGRGVVTAQYNMDTKNRITFCSNCGKRGHPRRVCWAKGGGAEGQGPSFRQVSAKNHHETSRGLKPKSN